MTLESSIQGQRLRYFGPIIRESNSIEKNVMLGKSEGERRRGRQTSRWLEGVTELIVESLAQLCQRTLNRRGWREDVQRITRRRVRLDGTYTEAIHQQANTVNKRRSTSVDINTWLRLSTLVQKTHHFENSSKNYEEEIN